MLLLLCTSHIYTHTPCISIHTHISSVTCYTIQIQLRLRLIYKRFHWKHTSYCIYMYYSVGSSHYVRPKSSTKVNYFSSFSTYKYTNNLCFCVLSPVDPITITGVSPESGSVGDTLVISGENIVASKQVVVRFTNTDAGIDGKYNHSSSHSQSILTSPFVLLNFFNFRC